MLILPHSSLLNDGKLSLAEATARQREENDRSRQRFRLPHQDELTNASARLGKPMTHTELINKVKRIAPSVWSEDSIAYSGGCNFYKQVNGEKVCLQSPFEKGYLPEYTIVHVNENNLPYRRTVGWREVLYRLIAKRILTLRDVNRAFGTPTSTPVNLWNKNIHSRGIN